MFTLTRILSAKTSSTIPSLPWLNARIVSNWTTSENTTFLSPSAPRFQVACRGNARNSNLHSTRHEVGDEEVEF
jgi:uncharacterized protein with LGFP repeats